jgi:ribosomal protein S18 acetylase RimI-like enzyme
VPLLPRTRWRLSRCRGIVGPVPLTYQWRGPLADAEMIDLVVSHGGRAEEGWWPQVQRHSLGWVTARDDRQLVGFVNVAWDGSDHAFLIDVKTRGTYQHRGIGTEVIRLAVAHARVAGCEWLHVDFQNPELAAFYVNACGFSPIAAGVIHLPSWPTRLVE